MATTVPADATLPARSRPGVRAHVTLGVLTIIYVFNFVDRQILNVLAEPIAKDLGLSDTQIGLMTGLAFAAFYTVLGIPLARLADNPKSNRIALISVCLAIWSGMTVLSGLAQNYAQLLLARIGVGAGEAGCTPAAITVIADTFPRERRASAMGVYMAGVPIGSLFGLMLGGTLADAFGWRVALMVVGLPGVLLAILLFAFVREPRRLLGFNPSGKPAAAPVKLGAVLRELARSRTYVLLTAANSVGAFLAYGVGVWQVIFFIRSHHLSAGQVGLWLGLVGGCCGLLGSALGGQIGDRLGARNPRHYFTVPAIGALVAIPLHIFAYSVGEWRLAIALLAVPAIIGTLNYGPGMAVTQGIFRPEARAMATAVKLFIQTLIGLGLGPLAFGMVSDALKPVAGADSVRWVLLGATSLGFIPAIGLWFAGKHIPRELKYDGER